MNSILDNAELILNEYKKHGKKFFFKNIEFKFVGEGGFGTVFKAKYKNSNYTIKIFKKPNPKEVNKCILLNKKIKEINNKFNSLVEKYITKVISTSPKMDMIILDYAEGEDVKSYIENNKIDDEKFSILVCKIIIAIRLFHKILKLSHRDIKPKNFIFDKKTYNLKLIDYGFICEVKDKDCYSHYQGTSSYIHPNLNKNAINSYNDNYVNKNSKSISSTSIISKSNKSKKIKKNKSNFYSENSKKISKLSNQVSNNIINSKSQDIFSLIITIFFIFTYVNNSSHYNNSVKKIINE